ncbi:MAG TPA: hypothetical protein VFG21_03310 [Xanthomonadaceae bacterium]|nr:hypothetical protein [Xanthomonadaceae bacterium]
MSVSRLLVILLFLLAFPALAGSGWQVSPTPTAEILNGVSAATRHFSIAVGNNGSIVHFLDGDAGTLVASGTGNDLLDVYALAPDMAAASGQDVVLLWDGVSWAPIAENDSGTPVFYSPVWITPERDLVLYGTLGQTFNIVCPHDPGATQQGFCRAFSFPTLAFCGHSGDIRMVLTSGSIMRFDNSLVDPDDPNNFDPLFEQQPSLNLKAAWVPPGACASGPIPPLDIFAIDDLDRFWRFDGETPGWTMIFDEISPGHTLTWLSGSGGNHVLAVGFQPAVAKGGGNEGVAWRYQGSTWTQETLAPGTPGLSDVTVTLDYETRIFGHGFENTPVVKGGVSRPGLFISETSVGEAGSLAGRDDLLPAAVSDLGVAKFLLTEPPYSTGDTVQYRLVVTNAGPDDATGVSLTEHFSNLSYGSDTCSSVNSVVAPGRARLANIGNLASGDRLECTFSFTITDLPFSNTGIVYSKSVSDPELMDNAAQVRTVP